MQPAAVKPEITTNDLDKIDVRAGTILRVEDVRGSRKLVVLTVDFGDHRRQVVVGLKAERENPAEITGKQALFVVNLKPRQIAGVLSEAMVFDVGHADGIVPVLAVTEQRVPDGARAG